MVSASTKFDAIKVVQEVVLFHTQDDGSDVAARTFEPVYTVNGASCTVIAVEVVCVDAPDGGDKQFTADVKKMSQASPSPASILYEPITVDSTVSDGEVSAAVITSASLSDGDTIGVTITPSGSTGNQGQGVIVAITLQKYAAA
jgi:hypothetical protein